MDIFIMKKILCFGDSNTWGCSPHDGTRFDEKTRWPMVMGSILGEGFTVIEEGLNGRTVLSASPVESDANGVDCIAEIVEKNAPVDITVICLGTNDIFVIDEVTLDQISYGMERIIDTVRGFHVDAGMNPPAVIVMAPAGYNSSVEGSYFYELQINKLKCLPDIYRKLADRKNCLFFNAADYVTGSPLDGSHLEAAGHILLGQKLAEFIGTIP